MQYSFMRNFRGAVLLGALMLMACSGENMPKATIPPCDLKTGELMFTELKLGKAGQDDSRWLEFRNNSTRPLSLHRAALKIETPARTQYIPLSLTQYLPMGSYMTVGEPPPGPYAITLDKNLYFYTTTTHVTLLCQDRMIDTVDLEKLRIERGSKEFELALVYLDHAVTALQKTQSQTPDWCALTKDENPPFTPGEVNPRCGTRYCQDGETLAEVPTLAPLDITINEVFADAPGADAAQEWLELKINTPIPTTIQDPSTTSIYLNGLHLKQQTSASQQRNWWLQAPQCIKATAGKFFVLGVRPMKVGPEVVTPLGMVDHWLTGDELFNVANTISLTHFGVEIHAANLDTVKANNSWSLDPNAAIQQIQSSADYCAVTNGSPNSMNICNIPAPSMP